MSDDAPKLQAARDILAAAKHVAVFSGAGISADAGMSTYRGPDGLWEGERVRKVAFPDGFAADPAGVWAWYNHLRGKLGECAPAGGHLALARLEEKLAAADGSVTICTQNIDNLHAKAGSTRVFELHGSLLRAKCCTCTYHVDIGCDPVSPLPPPCPECGDILRLDVVWFTESLPSAALQGAVDAVAACDTFITVGTSAVVYPAAGLIDLALKRGVPCLEVNLKETPYTPHMTVSLRGRAADILPQLID